MAAKTPTLEDIADAGLIPHDVELRCIVRNRTFLENINGIDFSVTFKIIWHSPVDFVWHSAGSRDGDLNGPLWY